MTTVSKLEQSIKALLAPKGIRVGRWSGGTRTSASLIALGTVPKTTVLYAKESGSTPGFWGLTKNQLTRLRDSEECWFAVLMRVGTPSGYVLSASQVEQRIKDGTFELSRDGDHKVNEDTDLDASQSFKSCEELIAKVL